MVAGDRGWPTVCKDDDSAIGGLGLATINDTGSRFSVPVTLSARWDF
ncbi:MULTISPECIES: hypothetical protein [unclassified Luteimonas]